MSAAPGVDVDDNLGRADVDPHAATRPSCDRSRPIATRSIPASVDEPLLVAVERGERRMAGFGLALAVVAGHLGDQLDLGVGEADELAVADHVVRVQVVLAVGDHQPDVGQQRTRLQVVALGVAEAVQLLQAVEQLDGEAGDVGRVHRVVVAALGSRRTLRRDTSRSSWPRPAASPATARRCRAARLHAARRR